MICSDFGQPLSNKHKTAESVTPKTSIMNNSKTTIRMTYSLTIELTIE